MRSVEVESVQEYVHVVTSAQRGGPAIWFRGVSDASYGLTPGLVWRNDMAWEHNYVHAFLVGYRAYVHTPPRNPWDTFCLMQHHGLPTRLLDWTKSPLAALFFALTQDPDRSSVRAVWVLPPHDLNKRTIGLETVFCPGGLESREIEEGGVSKLNLDAYLPEALNPADYGKLPAKPIAIEAPMSFARIRGQQGCFTVHGTAADGLESYFTDDDPAPFLARIDLASDNRQVMLADLYSLGINEESVYQDLDALCSRIRREQGQP